MARPILRLATRTTPRTRATAWGIAFACMVLVGALSLVDGLRSGVDSVLGRFDTGPRVYIRGDDLLASRIDENELASVSLDFLGLRVHAARLGMNGLTLDIVVAALETHHDGNVSTDYPLASRDVSLDVGLREAIERDSGRPLEANATLSLFGLSLTGLPVVAAPPTRLELFPDTWAYVRPELLISMSAQEGGPLQALVAESALDPSVVSALGLSRLDAVGAVGFVRGSIDEAGTALRLLAVVIAIVIALVIYSAMSLEVHQRAREIRTLRSLGASPGTVAAIYEGQALTLAILGATVGSALGVVLAHAVVSFAPLLGLTNLVILSPPIVAVGLAYLLAIVAAAVAGFVPSRRAALVVRGARGVGGS